MSFWSCATAAVALLYSVTVDYAAAVAGAISDAVAAAELLNVFFRFESNSPAANKWNVRPYLRDSGS